MLKKKIVEHNRVLESLIKLEPEIIKSINLIYKILKKKGKILICGNGGSAADAQHLAAEFIVRLKSSFNRKALPIIPLALDTSTITACSNDYGFENVFSRTFEALSSKGDLLIVLSTSGNSKNIINVLKKSKQKKIKTICFLGNKGGEALSYCDSVFLVPSKVTARIQESHITAGHALLQYVEDKLLEEGWLTKS